MNIHSVRRRFQHKVDFFIPSKYTGNIFQGFYSLQQDPLNSERFLLYITISFKPNIVGHLIFIKNQPWLVHRFFKEVVNLSLYEYLLMPTNDMLDILVIRQSVNALGTSNTEISTDGNNFLLDGNSLFIPNNRVHCILDTFSRKERINPTVQPADAYERTFFIARSQMIDYQVPIAVYYKGIRFKVMSKTPYDGAVELRATQEL